jgi:hypothetical protein
VTVLSVTIAAPPTQQFAFEWRPQEKGRAGFSSEPDGLVRERLPAT